MGARALLWTRQNKPWSAGRYRVYLTRGLETRSFRDGHYRVEIVIQDTAGNAGRHAQTVVVRNGRAAYP